MAPVPSNEALTPKEWWQEVNAHLLVLAKATSEAVKNDPKVIESRARVDKAREKADEAMRAFLAELRSKQPKPKPKPKQITLSKAEKIKEYTVSDPKRERMSYILTSIVVKFAAYLKLRP